MKVACLCEGQELRATFRDDLERYVFIVQVQHSVTGPLAPLRIGLLAQGLWATAAYRLNHYARYRLRSRLLSLLLGIFHRVIAVLTGIQKIGRAHV